MIFLYVGKVLTALATPLGIATAVLAFAAFSLRRAPRSFLFWTILFSTALLLFCSSGCGSQLLLRSLEWPYASATVAAAPTAQAIVVLGGYLRVENRTGRPVEIGGASDRLLCAAELYRAGKAPFILLSGGNVSFASSPANQSSEASPEAVLAGRILEEWGIPSSAILIEDQSRSTHENAVFSGRILRGKGITRILLVTSAYHMRRAAATFRTTGLTILPFAADFLSEAEAPDLPFSLLPDAQSASNSGLAIKEWLGIAVYRRRNWAD